MFSTPSDRNYDWRCPDPADISLLARISGMTQSSPSNGSGDEAAKELCRRCKQRVCFKPKLLASASYYGGEDIGLGTWKEVKARKSCPFCTLVVSAVKLGPEPDAIREEEEIIVDWTIDKGYSVNLAMPGTHIGFVLDEFDDDKPEIWQDQEIEKSWFEPEKVCEWLSNCEDYHGEVCGPLVESIARKFDHSILRATGCAFRLIDTTRYCIVEGVNDPYIALSYVWSGVKGLQLKEDNKEELLAFAGLKTYWNEIPQTVRDAFSLVKRMGKRYFPIDIQFGVSMMDLVYCGASLTIIAAAGKDSNADLPGVRFGTRPSAHPVEEVQPDLSMTILQDMDNVLATTTYAKRAWTFQEQLLSQRTLTFLPNGSVFFRCLRAQWSEEDTNELRPEDTTWQPDYLYSALDGQMSTVACFDALMMHYTKRTMSFQADAQRAFQRLEKLLQRDLACKFLQSMPCSAFDLFILFTGHFNTLKRRNEFPSWSWLGWIGTLKMENRILLMYLDDCREWLAERTWITWYYCTPEGELKNVLPEHEAIQIPNTGRHVTYGPRRKFDNKHCPSIDVSNTIPSEKPQGSQTSPATIPTLNFWTLSVFLTISHITTSPLGDGVCDRGTIVDANGDFCGSIHLDGNFMARSHHDQPIELIVLSESCGAMGGSAIENRELEDKSRWDLYWVMLIERGADDEPAERGGIGQIFQDAIGRALTPGPTWKEIILA